jgi:predicted membrane channel-forming protein YqfA (hemolysin III family)
MAKTGSRVVGIVALVLSLASAGYGARWFAIGRIKHGLLFAVIFVILALFGLIMVRAREKSAEQQTK